MNVSTFENYFRGCGEFSFNSYDVELKQRENRNTILQVPEQFFITESGYKRIFAPAKYILCDKCGRTLGECAFFSPLQGGRLIPYKLHKRRIYHSFNYCVPQYDSYLHRFKFYEHKLQISHVYIDIYHTETDEVTHRIIEGDLYTIRRNRNM